MNFDKLWTDYESDYDTVRAVCTGWNKRFKMSKMR